MKSESKLRKVFAVRHGEYDRASKGLNDKGREQGKRLAEKISMMIPAETDVIIICSPQIRALQSAEILAVKLHCEIEACPILELDDYELGEAVLERIFPIIRHREVAIVMTHFELPSGIINALAKARFQKVVDCSASGYGNGLAVDLLTGEIIDDVLLHNVSNS